MENQKIWYYNPRSSKCEMMYIKKCTNNVFGWGRGSKWRRKWFDVSEENEGTENEFSMKLTCQSMCEGMFILAFGKIM